MTTTNINIQAVTCPAYDFETEDAVVLKIRLPGIDPYWVQFQVRPDDCGGYFPQLERLSLFDTLMGLRESEGVHLIDALGLNGDDVPIEIAEQRLIALLNSNRLVVDCLRATIAEIDE